MAAKYKITINPEYEHLRKFITAIPDRGENLGTVIYCGRNVVYDNAETGTRLCIKSFKIPAIYNRIAYTFIRKSKARRSYENALRLLEAGVLSPTPVAYIEVYRGGLLERSYYVCLMVEAEHVRVWQERPNAEDIARNLADLLYRLHSARIWHRDFSPGNVLYDKAGHYYVIDINRMQFGVTSKRIFVQNFARINESEAATEHLLRLYAERAGIADADSLVAEAMKYQRRFWDGVHRKDARRQRKMNKNIAK